MKDIIAEHKNRVAGMLVLLALLAGGCSKGWLDAKTDKNLAVPSTLNDFQTLLDNTGEMNANSCGIGEVASDGHLVSRPDKWLKESDQEHNAYTWTHDHPVVKSPDWDDSYRRIAVCNQVLEGLAAIKPVNAADKAWWNEMKGAALFQRGRSFFELAQVFAPSYASSPAPGNWGIPLRLTTDILAPSVRSGLGDTYGRVLSDLRAAKDLLPLSAAYKTRPSKPAALAQLARVWLAMEQYDSAYLYADGCLQLNNHLLDYNGLDTAAGYPIKIFNEEVLFHATLVNWGNIKGDALVDSSLFSLYGNGDLRRSLFFNDSGLFKGSYYGEALLFSGLAVDEQYLIRAECKARRGDANGAMADMDTLLGKRYSKALYVAPVAAGPREALDIVLRERRKELYLRGLRWTDLRRLDHEPAYRDTIRRQAGNTTFKLPPGSYRYTFPIPDDIIQVSGIAQNPGW